VFGEGREGRGGGVITDIFVVIVNARKRTSIAYSELLVMNKIYLVAMGCLEVSGGGGGGVIDDIYQKLQQNNKYLQRYTTTSPSTTEIL
jgi:hypothetical protein